MFQKILCNEARIQWDEDAAERAGLFSPRAGARPLVIASQDCGRTLKSTNKCPLNARLDVHHRTRINCETLLR